MPRVLLMVCAALFPAACGVTPPEVLETAATVTVGSISIIHRSPIDALYSLVTGKDCSIVRLDKGLTYCRPIEPLPAPPPYCTRSIGNVDCWSDPQALVNPPPELANGPLTLTPEQDADRTRRWPPL
jgi:hypothetical protein